MEADLELGTIPGSAAAASNGTLTSNGERTSNGEKATEATSKPVVAPGGKQSGLNGVLANDEITSTLAAASEKLQAAHRKEQDKKPRSGLSKCLGALYPKRILTKLRDCYINTCMMAAERGEFADIVAGHPGMYYGDTVLSRNISQSRDREHEEIMQASLSRQVSISLSRQQSQSGGLNPKIMRNSSAGMAGLSRNPSVSQSAGMNSKMMRNASTGMSGLSRNPSVGLNR